MRKAKGFSVAWVVVGVVVVALLGVLTYAIVKGNSNEDEDKYDYSQYNAAEFVDATEANGQIADHIKGAEDAPLTIVEYMNYGCNHCAAMDGIVTQVADSSDGQVRFVVRTLDMAAFRNSKAAAAAAEAAAMQGYWKKYAAKLLANQAQWSAATGAERKKLFDQYFEEVTDGQGDLKKFNEDIASEAVADKLKFDTKISDQLEVEGTPYFFVEGQHIDLAEGGDVIIDGKTVTLEPATGNDGFEKVIKQLITAKTNN